MAGSWRYVASMLCLAMAFWNAAAVRPISNAHRSAALEAFVPVNGAFGSLEETFEALRTFEVLGLDSGSDVKLVSCRKVVETLASSSPSTKDVFFALKISGILRCQIDSKVFQDVQSKIEVVVKSASSLPDFYHSIGSLVLIKDQFVEGDVQLKGADEVFHSIKALSQSDGRWRFNSNEADPSTYAAGMAFETLAGVIKLADSEVDQSKIGIVKNDIVKLFDTLESYDDGTLYFDEKRIDAKDHMGPLFTSLYVVRGFTAYVAVASGKINIPGEKILGLANFFLGIGIPGNGKDLFYQIDALGCLESNRISVPLILSLPTTVLSFTSKDLLKVKVNTVLGSDAPHSSVILVQAISLDSRGSSALQNDKLIFDEKKKVHSLDLQSKGIDIGRYSLVFEVVLHESELEKSYATGGKTKVLVHVTGLVKIEKPELALLDSDTGSAETRKKLDLSGDSSLSLFANHLQKLHLSFELITPMNHAFNPHQVFIELQHESKVKHIFVVGNSGKRFELVLDFLGLVDKLYYLSGRYEIHLTIGDAVMENSLLRNLGHLDLELPEPSEKAPRPPAQAVDPYSRFGPKAEISHIFRAPEKRPPQELSFAFLGLTLLPFVVFVLGLIRLRVNFKKFPSSSVPATAAILFHLGIAAVLFLYVLFWIKLNLFTTLKGLGFIGVFLVFVGHRTLSALADKEKQS